MMWIYILWMSTIWVSKCVCYYALSIIYSPFHLLHSNENANHKVDQRDIPPVFLTSLETARQRSQRRRFRTGAVRGVRGDVETGQIRLLPGYFRANGVQNCNLVCEALPQLLQAQSVLEETIQGDKSAHSKRSHAPKRRGLRAEGHFLHAATTLQWRLPDRFVCDHQPESCAVQQRVIVQYQGRELAAHDELAQGSDYQNERCVSKVGRKRRFLWKGRFSV